MNGLNFFPVIHVRQKRLQSLVGNVSDWARLEALVLQYRYLRKVMSEIHADTFHFLDGSIAIFCIGKTDNDGEQREVIAFRLTFQYIPTDFANDHRFLVNEKFKVMMAFMEQLAINYQKGYYDLRNEWACTLAHATIEALREQQLYYPSSPEYSPEK